MNNRQSIIIIALKLTTLKGLNNFRRNPSFYKSFAFFYIELLAKVNKLSSCIELKQQDNNILIVWNCTNTKIEDLIQFYRVLHTIRRKTNKAFVAFPIKYSIVVEFSSCNLLQLPFNNKAPKFLLESDMIDRTQKVLSSLDGTSYPSIMFTHSFYELLPASIKEFMNTPYYFFHICCYSIRKHSN